MALAITCAMPCHVSRRSICWRAQQRVYLAELHPHCRPIYFVPSGPFSLHAFVDGVQPASAGFAERDRIEEFIEFRAEIDEPPRRIAEIGLWRKTSLPQLRPGWWIYSTEKLSDPRWSWIQGFPVDQHLTTSVRMFEIKAVEETDLEQRSREKEYDY